MGEQSRGFESPNESAPTEAGAEQAIRDSEMDSSDALALEVDGLVTSFFELQRSGDGPSAEDFIAQHPEHEHSLRAVLPVAHLLDLLGQRAEDSTPSAGPGERIGEYRLLGVLGRGGMGVVYEAVQEALDRPVALKVLPASRVVDRKSRERFTREAQAAAGLQHPGIVPVYGVGEADGQVYFAMQRIDGIPLDLLAAAALSDACVGDLDESASRALRLASRLKSGAGLESSACLALGSAHSGSFTAAESCGGADAWVRSVVRIGLQAAEALSYAHSRGVLHRDVKPSNLMLDDDGRVYVTDFGLCKTAGDSSLTAAGDVVGTLRYVPPERFQGRDDVRGDVYGVGVILYELLCGRAAFPQQSRAELVHAVSSQVPPRPRRLNSRIPGDLETIIRTATAQLPEERYASMEALISDLLAFQRGRPILARAPGALYLIRLFARRNRALVLTVAAALLLLTVLGSMYVGNLRFHVQELRIAEGRARESTVYAELGAAASAIAARQDALARRHLSAIPRAERDWIWSTMDARLRTAILVADSGEGPVIAGALDASHGLVALIREDGVRVSDVGTGELVGAVDVVGAERVVFLPGVAVLVLSISSGDELAFVPYDSSPSARESAARYEQQAQELSLGRIQSLDSNESHLAVSTNSGQVVIFDGEGERAPSVFQCAAAESGHVALIGNRGAAVHASRGEAIYTLGPEPEKVVRSSIPQRGAIVDVVGSRDIARFAVLTTRGWVHLLDADESGAITRREPFRTSLGTRHLAIAPDGGGLMACGEAGSVRVWRPGRGAPVANAVTLRSGVSVLLWPGGGEALVSAGVRGDWRKYPIPSSKPRIPGVSRSRAHFIRSADLSVNFDGRFHASVDCAGGWAVWDSDRRLPFAASIDRLERTTCAALEITGRGGWLAIGGEGLQLVEFVDVRSGMARARKVPGVSDVRSVAWIGEPGKACLRVVEASGRIIEVDPRSAECIPVGDAGGPVDLAAFIARGGDLILARTDESRLMRFHADSGEFRPLLELEQPIHAIECDRSGAVIAVCTEDQVLRVYGIEEIGLVPYPWSHQIAEVHEQGQGSTSFAIDVASGWIVSVCSDGECRTWALESGLPGPELLRIHGRLVSVAFPRPGEPPIVLEQRGRIDHFEVDGIDRSEGSPGVEPTPAERRALDVLSPDRRLSGLLHRLDAPGLTLDEALLLEDVAKGLSEFAAYNAGRLPVERARAAERLLHRRVTTLKATGRP